MTRVRLTKKRPPLVVVRAADTDAVFDVAQRKTRRVLGFRRRYLSTCGVCGEPLAAARG